MEGVSAAVSQILVLAIIVVVGFVLTKIDYIDERTSQKLMTILMNVTLPALIISSATSVQFDEIASQIPLLVLLGVVLFFLMALVSCIACLVLRVSLDTFACYVFSGICTQTAFIGIPVIGAVLGEHTIILTSLFVAVVNVFLFSLGYAMLAVDQQLRVSRQASINSESSSSADHSFSLGKALSSVELTWRNFVNPALFAALIALVLLFLRVPVPGVVSSALDLVGGMTAPISMMLIGYFVSRMHLSEVISDWRVFAFGFIRYLLGSIALFYLLSLLVQDDMLVAIAVLEFAMPAGAMVPAFVASYQGDALLASKNTVISSVLSFVYLPIIIIVMSTFPLV